MIARTSLFLLAVLGVLPVASYSHTTHDQLVKTFKNHAGTSKRGLSTDDRIESFYHDSAFPKAGRSLRQKIDEANRFLTDEVRKTGIVGVGATVVYRDQVALATGYGLQAANNNNNTASASSSRGATVSKDTLFQIGSVSKLMIAVGVGLLVDEGKMQWHDTAKKHLPWLQLGDKYAEQHLTVGNLLSMNSGMGRRTDLADYFGDYTTERAYVEALKDVPPEHSLREQPEYANTNFAILGEIIASVSGQSWPTFLRERLWVPLNMTHTFASANLVSADVQPFVSAGHYVCAGEAVRGPFDLATSTEAVLIPDRTDGLIAAGSIVSSAADMATFIRLILNKGHVNGVKLFRDPATISEMITGKNVAAFSVPPDFLDGVGLHYSPDGASLSAGYGIDLIGQLLWGHAYFDKGGDTALHHTRTGFVPHERLAVVLMENSMVLTPKTITHLDLFRSYIMGIFLDVPKRMLDVAYAKGIASVPAQPPIAPGAPVCGPDYWTNPPAIPPSVKVDLLVGSYKARLAPDYFPVLTIARQGEDRDAHVLSIQIGKRNGTVLWLQAFNATTDVLLAHMPSFPMRFKATAAQTQYTLDLGGGVLYDKQD